MSIIYPLDFLAKTLSGNGFQVQKRINLLANETKYLVLDFSMITDNVIFGLPIEASSAGGFVHLNTYSCDSYTQGAPVEILRLNPKVDRYSQAPMYEATLPIGKYALREYNIGTQVTNQSSGGGFATNDSPKILANRATVFEFINQENVEVSVAFGYVWFES